MTKGCTKLVLLSSLGFTFHHSFVAFPCSSLPPSLPLSSHQGLLHALLAVLHPPSSSSSSSSSLPPFRRRAGKPGTEDDEDEDEEEEEVDPALVHSNAAGFVHVTGRKRGGRAGGRRDGD